MTLEGAETLALNALGFLADSPEAMERLMDQSGLDRDTIRQRAADRDFLAALLDFLMANEALLVDFCHGQKIEPRAVEMAVYRLGGA